MCVCVTNVKADKRHLSGLVNAKIVHIEYTLYYAHQPPTPYSYSSNVNVHSVVAYDAFNATTNDYGADRWI